MLDFPKNHFPRNPRPSEPEISLGKTQAGGVAGDARGTQEAPFTGDWRARYHSMEDVRDAPPVTFIIDQFLSQNGVTAIVAPVAQRKSLIALNVAHAAVTGEPLFGKFSVPNKPTRVLYLCPEMGLHSFSERLKKIGLLGYVGETLFCRTMSGPGDFFPLQQLSDEELQGALVIVDTVVRYLEGDENSSEDMRKFAAVTMGLVTRSAASVLLLHHSNKGTSEADGLTLQNAVRGSGELGAFLASCWATRLQDGDDPYNSRSYLSNVKQRDFESKPFEVESGADCRLTYVESEAIPTLKKRNPNKPNKDGMDDAAEALIKANPNVSGRKLPELLAAHGIKRAKDWCTRRRAELGLGGAKLSSDPGD